MDMAKLFGVYMIRNTITGAQYIGMTRKSFDERWRGHRTALAKGQHASPSLQADWNQYGEGAFQFSIVEAIDDIQQVPIREAHWVQELNPAYNTMPGGRVGRPPKRVLRAELRLNAEHPMTVALECEAESRGISIQEYISDLLMTRYLRSKER